MVSWRRPEPLAHVLAARVRQEDELPRRVELRDMTISVSEARVRVTEPIWRLTGAVLVWLAFMVSPRSPPVWPAAS